MRRNRARRMAAPFVATMTLAACTKNGDGSKIVGDPGTTNDSAITTGADATPAPALTNDGFGNCYSIVDGEKKYAPRCPEALLAAPPTGELVYRDAEQCHRVPDGVPVQCPAGGPTGILPDPSSISMGGSMTISLQYGTLSCLAGHVVKCPPGVMCNPPPPETIPCPDALLPKLSPGVKPTKRDGAQCWYGSVVVACPASTAAAGDCPKAHPSPGVSCPKLDVVCPYSMSPEEGSASVELCACAEKPPVTTMPSKTGEWVCHRDPKAPVYSK